jgi:hypothetical protein
MLDLIYVNLSYPGWFLDAAGKQAAGYCRGAYVSVTSVN